MNWLFEGMLCRLFPCGRLIGSTCSIPPPLSDSWIRTISPAPSSPSLLPLYRCLPSPSCAWTYGHYFLFFPSVSRALDVSSRTLSFPSSLRLYICCALNYDPQDHYACMAPAAGLDSHCPTSRCLGFPPLVCPSSLDPPPPLPPLLFPSFFSPLLCPANSFV
jgi:hypothetical protein